MSCDQAPSTSHNSNLDAYLGTFAAIYQVVFMCGLLPNLAYSSKLLRCQWE